MRRTGTALIAALLVFAGCGGDDTDSTDGDDASADVSGDAGDDAESGDAESEDADSDSDSDADVADADGGDAPAAGNGTATVVIDGTTYQFAQVEPGPDDDYYYTFCSTVAGTLQAVFPLVDDTGTVVEGGELSVIFLEPGGIAADQGESPEFSVSVDQQFWFHEEGQPIDVPADGRSASGTATLLQSGTMNAETGAIETTPFDVTIEMSC